MSADAVRLRAERRLRRHRGADRVWMPWTVAWLGGSLLGTANGVTRELFYKDQVGDLTAHQISTATGITLFALYFWLLHRRWPLRTTRRALQVGATWLLLTLLFEAGFGHYVDGKAWTELLHDYDLADGRVWSLLLAWIALGPAIIGALVAKRSTR